MSLNIVGKKKKKLQREEPEFDVQKEYENQFKTDFQKMLITMNKTILLKFSNIGDNEDVK